MIIVGAGISGCVLSERLASLGHKVMLIEKTNHIGGNCYDYINEDGILVPKYGPHLFHTNSEKVWEYVNRFSEWTPYEHRVLAEIDGELKIVPPTQDYADKVFKGYTKKFWGKYYDKLKPEVRARVKIRTDNDDRYFKDKYQAMPKEGYTKMFEKMLSHPNIEVRLNTDFFKTGLKSDYYTGRLDEYHNYKYGKLPFRSLKFKHQTLKMEYYQPVAVVNYPQTKRYTRITEPKHATGQICPKTTIIREYPTWKGEPYYPVPTLKTEALAEKYKQANFLGRLGTYQYLNMDQAILNALNEELTNVCQSE